MNMKITKDNFTKFLPVDFDINYFKSVEDICQAICEERHCKRNDCENCFLFSLPLSALLFEIIEMEDIKKNHYELSDEEFFVELFMYGFAEKIIIEYKLLNDLFSRDFQKIKNPLKYALEKISKDFYFYLDKDFTDKISERMFFCKYLDTICLKSIINSDYHLELDDRLSPTIKDIKSRKDWEKFGKWLFNTIYFTCGENGKVKIKKEAIQDIFDISF